MKEKLHALLSKPRKVIPVAFVLALIVGVFALTHVGKAPVVTDVSLTATSTSIDSGTVSVAFNASGNVESVNVSVGDKVYRGETLATLDAGVALGALDQAKGALELAQAQYGSLTIGYTNAKTQQDILVENAYRTLLSSGLQALPSVNDETHDPMISGTYTCDKEGSYQVAVYPSGTPSGYSFNVTGLETANSLDVTYGTPQAFGNCGLQITFVQGFIPSTKWTVTIPNTQSSSYQANKNAYDLAVSTREQVLSQLSANLGANGTTGADVASASISAAQGAYDAALAQYNNNVITAPEDGTVSFVDANLKVGQSVVAGRPVVTISSQ